MNGMTLWWMWLGEVGRGGNPDGLVPRDLSSLREGVGEKEQGGEGEVDGGSVLE